MQIVIEEPSAFSKFIEDIYIQMKGEKGTIVLSENYVPIDLKNKAEIITQLIPFNVNTKELLNKVYAKLRADSVKAEIYNFTQDVLSLGEKYLFELTKDTSSSLVYDRPEDISWILKGFNLCFENDGLSLSERLFEYMTAVMEYVGKSTFFIVGLRSYVPEKEDSEFYKSVLLNGITLICIESHETVLLENEHRVIIDQDLCII